MYKSFAITVRPRNGIPVGSPLQNQLVNKLKKYEYCSIYMEMENEARHMHCQIWLDKPVAIGTIKTAMVRIQEKYDPDWCEASKKCLRGGIKIAYSDWILDYCEDNDLKADDPNCLFHRVPPVTSEYYATEEEQQKIIDSSKSRNQTYFRLKHELMEDVKYKYFKDRIEKLSFGFKKYSAAIWQDVGGYLSFKMYNDDTYPIIKCPKLMNQTIKALARYICKDCEVSEFFSAHENLLIEKRTENIEKALNDGNLNK